jgi:hypothetical protein
MAEEKDKSHADKKKLENTKLRQDINFRKSEVILKDEEGELKKLEVAEKLIKVDEMRDNQKGNKEFTNMLKAQLLGNILTLCSIDEDTLIGSETKLKSTFDEEEQGKIKTKLFEIINKL